MKSITIHNIEDALDKKLQEKAKELGLSQNRTVKSILENALLDKTNKRESEFADLFGIWSEQDKREFNEKVSFFDRIDDTDWKL